MRACPALRPRPALGPPSLPGGRLHVPAPTTSSAAAGRAAGPRRDAREHPAMATAILEPDKATRWPWKGVVFSVTGRSCLGERYTGSCEASLVRLGASSGEIQDTRTCRFVLSFRIRWQRKWWHPVALPSGITTAPEPPSGDHAIVRVDVSQSSLSWVHAMSHDDRVQMVTPETMRCRQGEPRVLHAGERTPTT